jgi:xylan 1,4-beta-xylosidase
VTNHVLPRHPFVTESVRVELKGISSPRNVYVERIDDEHANAKRLWLEMGKPALPTEREVEQLHVASQIVRKSLPWRFEAGRLHLAFAMPPHAIAAITVQLTTKQHKREKTRS